MRTLAIAAMIAIGAINCASAALAALPSRQPDGWRSDVIVESPRQGSQGTQNVAY